MQSYLRGESKSRQDQKTSWIRQDLDIITFEHNIKNQVQKRKRTLHLDRQRNVPNMEAHTLSKIEEETKLHWGKKSFDGLRNSALTLMQTYSRKYE